MSGINHLHARAAGAAAVVSIAVLALIAGLTGTAGAAVAVVPLGTAESFAVLAGSGITNTGPTVISGDIGTFPTTTTTGTATISLTGTNHAGDAVTQQAKSDLVTAYNVAAGQSPPAAIAADLGGQTLTSGVYNSASAIGLTGALTLDGAGDPNAVFVFQAGSTLTTASGSRVSLTNGAQACNVFWQVGSSATIGTGSTFRGSILALTSITVTTGATLEGRVLARNGAVTLDTNTILRPTCVTAAASASSTPTATTSATATPATATPASTTPGATASAPTATVAGSAATASTAPSGTIAPETTPSTTQVTDIPRGSVRTGDGSSSPRRAGFFALPGLAFVLAVLAAVGGALVVRRRRVSRSS